MGDEIVWEPGLVQALGDSNELVVFRSAVVLDIDPVMSRVTEYINDHHLVLADQAFIEDDYMVGGLARVDRYLTAAARRDGAAEPGALESVLSGVESGQTYEQWLATR